MCAQGKGYSRREPRILASGPRVWQGEAAGLNSLVYPYHVKANVMGIWGAVFLWAVEEAYAV